MDFEDVHGRIMRVLAMVKVDGAQDRYDALVGRVVEIRLKYRHAAFKGGRRRAYRPDTIRRRSDSGSTMPNIGGTSRRSTTVSIDII